jgi:hypothetical protein
MAWNKADQILLNEVRKIDVKIHGHQSAIRKLEADKEEINKKISRD